MPRDAALLRWYMDIAKEGLRRGIIHEVTNIVDEYLMGKYDKK